MQAYTHATGKYRGYLYIHLKTPNAGISRTAYRNFLAAPSGQINEDSAVFRSKSSYIYFLEGFEGVLSDDENSNSGEEADGDEPNRQLSKRPATNPEQTK